MSAATGISWTDATWTPIRARRLDTGKVGVHCEKVSPACKNCYAERLNMRNLPQHGTGLEFTVLNRQKVEMFVDEKMLLWPLKWRKAKRIFVCSQTDLFGEFVTDEMIDQVFAVMVLCPQHTFQVLTKRPERMNEYLSHLDRRYDIEIAMYEIGGDYDQRTITDEQWPLPNVWLGVTAENQEWADKRIPLLLKTPAAKRFASVEPQLGPVDLDLPRCESHDRDEVFFDEDLKCECCVDCRADGRSGELSFGHWLDPLNGGIDWVIVGGESGPGARPFEIQWAESLINQCREAGVACFVKQLGADPRWAGANALPIEPARGKCDDPLEWPESLRVQQFPGGAA